MSAIHGQRVSQIRTLMASRGWDAVIITGTDPHSSEYPSPRWKQVEWVSGFSGEAGDLVITSDHAGLWTDSRYFIQAVEQLEGSGIELHKTRQPDSVDIPSWLGSVFEGSDAVIAFDGLCMSLDTVHGIESHLEQAGVEYRLCSQPDLLDMFWLDRPSVPQSPVVTLDENEVGESRIRKISWLRKFMMMTPGCEAVLLSSLDEIAWMLNVRGSDILYNPYVISYLLVTMDDVKWYVRKGPVEKGSDTADSFDELMSDGISICNYADLGFGLQELRENEEEGKVFIDPSTLNYEVSRLLRYSSSPDNVISGKSPVILRKAVKNPVEQKGFREAFFVDGLAMERFLYWLETSVADGEIVTEWDASAKLSSIRAETDGYRGDSFENISAYGANAALPHYSTPRNGSAVIRQEGLYLVDSGGQYLFGTTDITRTVPMGKCTDLEREDYTLVLKGMIDLAMAVFPEGTCGCHLDVLAREPLWRCKRNFGHGTGHGIGFYLGVHEGPQSIRQNVSGQALLPGMVTSDEPGIYREGMHGIRHENVIMCVEDGGNEFGRWLSFETLTCCHIDTAPIVRGLMRPDEIAWLNEYNASVWRRLSPYLNEDVRGWLKDKTQAI